MVLVILSLPFWSTLERDACVQLYSSDPLCKGEDWVAINELDDIDIASVHIYAEFWPVCTA